MCNLGKAKLEKKLALNGVGEEKKGSLEPGEDLPPVKLWV